MHRLPLLAAAVALFSSAMARGAEPPRFDVGLWGGVKITTMGDLKHETDVVKADMQDMGMTVATTGTIGPQAGFEAGWRLPAGFAACLRAGWVGRDGGKLTGTLSDAYGTARIVEDVSIDCWSVEAGGRYERPISPRLTVRGGLFAGLVRATADIRLRTNATGLYSLMLASGDHTVPYRATGLAAEALVGIAYEIAPRWSIGLDAGWRFGKTGALRATAAGDKDNDGAIDTNVGDARRSSDDTKDITLDFSGPTATLFVTLAL